MSDLRWIGPLEFIDCIGTGPSLAIIGNGGGLLGLGLGPAIDRWGLVVRFNMCTTFGFEKDVGTYTHIYVSNGLDAALRAPLESRCAVERLRAAVVLLPLEQIRPELVPTHTYNLPELPVPILNAFATLSALDREATQSGIRLHKWTTGTYAIYLLDRLLHPRRILLAGFDLFKIRHPSGHYFGTATKGRLRAIREHDLASEERIWELLVKRLSCEVVATPDVLRSIPGLAPTVRPIHESE